MNPTLIAAAFKVLILVCPADTLSHPGDCQRDNAVDVINGPAADNEVVCGMHGQAYVAETALRIAPGEWVKVTCTRTNIAAGNVG